MPASEITASHAAFLQTATAVVQAVVGISLLSWYVLASHIERLRMKRERADDFESLVALCQGLGLEAQARIATCRRAFSEAMSGDAAVQQLKTTVAAWKADMEVICVCLNEVPHYEVRSPGFSIALTRLWLEVDARLLDGAEFRCIHDFQKFLGKQHSSIGREIAAMTEVLTQTRIAGSPPRHSLTVAAQWRKAAYNRGRVSTRDPGLAVRERLPTIPRV